MKNLKSKLLVIHFTEDLVYKETRCGKEGKTSTSQNSTTCPECIELINDDMIEGKLEEACDAYDKYMELRNDLISMDELAAEKLQNWVDNHEG